MGSAPGAAYGHRPPRLLLPALRCGTEGLPGRIKATMIDFEVGVLLPSAVESSGTSGFVSG